MSSRLAKSLLLYVLENRERLFAVAFVLYGRNTEADANVPKLKARKQRSPLIARIARVDSVEEGNGI